MSDITQHANDPIIDALFSVGAHFGYRRSRRHPSASPFIFGVKGTVEIFDLEKTKNALIAAETFVAQLAKAGKMLLFVGGKKEAAEAVSSGATALGMPYVASRWIGGTLTNFGQIRGRVDKMLDFIHKREKGELAKYTKKERLLIDRDITRLDELFHGLLPLTALPAALFVIDPRAEETAMREARKQKIPVVALANSDCDMNAPAHAIPGNDAARASIRFFVDKIVEAYEKGKAAGVPAPQQ
jgi:small subunit ribosomal protein S2